MLIGLPSESLDPCFAAQRREMWCWAASLQMVFEYYGIGVSQEMLVHRSFGLTPYGTLPNKPGSFMDITAHLNTLNIDYHGRRYHVWAHLQPGIPDMNTLISELSARRPILISYQSRPRMNHAVICTAAEIKPHPFTGQPTITRLIVRDPAPTPRNRARKGRIEHMAQDFLPRIQAWWIIRIRNERSNLR
jgi:hypothetical protein